MKYKIKDGIIILDESILVNEEENIYINKINLKEMENVKLKNETIKGIPLTNIGIPIREIGQSIIVEYNFKYEDEKLLLHSTVKSKDNDLFVVNENIDIDSFVEEIMDNISNIKTFNINCSKTLENSSKNIMENIYNQAFQNKILLTDQEYNYRINIYRKNSKELIGIANRLALNGIELLLYEVIIFDNNNRENLTNIPTQIEMVISPSMSIIFDNNCAGLLAGKSICYASFGIDNTKTYFKKAKDDDSFNDKKLKFERVNLPRGTMISSLLQDLLENNTHDVLLTSYKKNKSMNIIKIDINKYLIE